MASKIAAYDLDGVLCEAPPHADKSFMKMNGAERKARKAFLLDWYKNAKPLYVPPENNQMLCVITARKGEDEIMKVTEEWLVRHFPGKVIKIKYLTKGRTLKNVILFKLQTLEDWGCTSFLEDNLKVLKGIRRAGIDCDLLYYNPEADYSKGYYFQMIV